MIITPITLRPQLLLTVIIIESNYFPAVIKVIIQFLQYDWNICQNILSFLFVIFNFQYAVCYTRENCNCVRSLLASMKLELSQINFNQYCSIIN